jgi:hypothetical protein
VQAVTAGGGVYADNGTGGGSRGGAGRLNGAEWSRLAFEAATDPGGKTGRLARWWWTVYELRAYRRRSR